MALNQPAGEPTELELRARIAELEQLLEARTGVIVTLHRRIEELEGRSPTELAERANNAEIELRALQSTKVFRLAKIPRSVYAKVRGR